MAANKLTPEKVKGILTSFLHVENNESVIDNTKSEKDGSTCKSSLSKPRDRNAFYHRVQTYTPFMWFAKPDELSPLQCSQYGWENVDTDMLQCTSCHMFLCAKLPHTFVSEYYTECCEKLKECLQTAHSRFCSWSNNPSPVWYSKLPLEDRHVVYQDYLKRVQSLLTMHGGLPKLDPETLDVGLDTLEQLVSAAEQHMMSQSAALSTDSFSKEEFTSATILSLTGWNKNSRSPDQNMLGCKFCQRQIGLWNFQVIRGETSHNCDKTTGDDDDEVKGSVIDVNTSFNCDAIHSADINGAGPTEPVEENQIPNIQSQENESCANRDKAESPEEGKQNPIIMLFKDSESENRPSIESHICENIDHTGSVQESQDSNTTSLTRRDKSRTEETVHVAVAEENQNHEANAPVVIEDTSSSKPYASMHDTVTSLFNFKPPVASLSKTLMCVFGQACTAKHQDRDNKRDVGNEVSTAHEKSSTSLGDSTTAGMEECSDATTQCSANLENQKDESWCDKVDSEKSNDDCSEKSPVNLMTVEQQKPSSADNSVEIVRKRSETGGISSIEECEEPPAKKMHKMTTLVHHRSLFDPLSEHRSWCPWVAPSSLGGGNSPTAPGWKTTIQLVSHITSSDQQGFSAKTTLKMPPHVGLRNIRKLLDGWESSEKNISPNSR